MPQLEVSSLHRGRSVQVFSISAPPLLLPQVVFCKNTSEGRCSPKSKWAVGRLNYTYFRILHISIIQGLQMAQDSDKNIGFFLFNTIEKMGNVQYQGLINYSFFFLSEKSTPWNKLMGKYLQTYTVCKDWNSQQRTVFSISILRDAKVNQKERCHTLT